MALFQRSITLLRYCIPLIAYRTPSNARNIKRWVSPTLKELERRKRIVGPQPPQPRSTYLEWNYDAEIFAFAKRLGEEFENVLLRRAFMHCSYVIQQELNGDENSLQDNRELIKEGDLLISNCINRNFETVYPAEVVNAVCTHLTSEALLAHVAFHMGVKDLIKSADFPPEKITLANTFRAIVGALNRSDESRTESFVKDFLICQLNGKDIMDLWDLKEPYNYLQQLLKSKGYPQMEPRLCNQSATHTILANYQVGLYVDKKLLGIGWGESITTAKDTAALDAIQKLQNIK